MGGEMWHGSSPDSFSLCFEVRLMRGLLNPALEGVVVRLHGCVRDSVVDVCTQWRTSLQVNELKRKRSAGTNKIQTHGFQPLSSFLVPWIVSLAPLHFFWELVLKLILSMRSSSWPGCRSFPLRFTIKNFIPYAAEILKFAILSGYCSSPGRSSTHFRKHLCCSNRLCRVCGGRG